MSFAGSYAENLSSSDDMAIGYVLPASWITSYMCLAIIGEDKAMPLGRILRVLIRIIEGDSDVYDCLVLLHCVHEKTAPKHVLKSSKLASFAQLQFSSMNICLFSIKLPILVKICLTVIEILTFNKWS